MNQPHLLGILAACTACAGLFTIFGIATRTPLEPKSKLWAIMPQRLHETRTSLAVTRALANEELSTPEVADQEHRPIFASVGQNTAFLPESEQAQQSGLQLAPQTGVEPRAVLHAITPATEGPGIAAGMPAPNGGTAASAPPEAAQRAPSGDRETSVAGRPSPAIRKSAGVSEAFRFAFRDSLAQKSPRSSRSTQTSTSASSSDTPGAGSIHATSRASEPGAFPQPIREASNADAGAQGRAGGALARLGAIASVPPPATEGAAPAQGVKVYVSNSPTGPWSENGTACRAGKVYTRTTGVDRAHPPKGCASPLDSAGCLNTSNHRDFLASEWVDPHTLQTVVNGTDFPAGQYGFYLNTAKSGVQLAGTATLTACATGGACGRTTGEFVVGPCNGPGCSSAGCSKQNEGAKGTGGGVWTCTCR